MVNELVHTETIDVTFVNKILSHCINYDYIINYEYLFYLANFLKVNFIFV